MLKEFFFQNPTTITTVYLPNLGMISQYSNEISFLVLAWKIYFLKPISWIRETNDMSYYNRSSIEFDILSRFWYCSCKLPPLDDVWLPRKRGVTVQKEQSNSPLSTVLLSICRRFNATIGTESHAGYHTGSSAGGRNHGGTPINTTMVKVAPKIAPEERQDTSDGECDWKEH